MPDHTAKECYAHIAARSGVDFHLSKEMLQRLPIAGECKFHKKVDIHAWMRQAEKYRSPGRVPVVFFRQSQAGKNMPRGKDGNPRPKILVTLDMDDFLDLVL
jgi:hypothetical protein